MINVITNAINSPISFLQLFSEEPLMVENVISEGAKHRTFLRMHRAHLKNLRFTHFVFCTVYIHTNFKIESGENLAGCY